MAQVLVSGAPRRARSHLRQRGAVVIALAFACLSLTGTPTPCAGQPEPPSQSEDDVRGRPADNQAALQRRIDDGGRPQVKWPRRAEALAINSPASG